MTDPKGETTQCDGRDETLDAPSEAAVEVAATYRLIDEAFANGKAQSCEGFEIVSVETIDSTNTYLLEAARRGLGDRRVVVTGHQSAGRGRRNRSWSDKPGESLLFSTLYRSTLDGSIDFGHLMGVAIVQACGELGVTAQLKWPNDVLIDGAKLAGILGESVVSGSHQGSNEIAVVVGCGINLNHHETSIENQRRVTSLADHVGMRIDADEFLHVVLAKCARLLRNPNSLVDAYRELCSTIGQKVRVERDEDAITGTAIDVDETGALILESQHERIRVTLGDVVHLRPVD